MNSLSRGLGWSIVIKLTISISLYLSPAPVFTISLIFSRYFIHLSNSFLLFVFFYIDAPSLLSNNFTVFIMLNCCLFKISPEFEWGFLGLNPVSRYLVNPSIFGWVVLLFVVGEPMKMFVNLFPIVELAWLLPIFGIYLFYNNRDKGFVALPEVWSGGLAPDWGVGYLWFSCSLNRGVLLLLSSSSALLWLAGLAAA